MRAAPFVVAALLLALPSAHAQGKAPKYNAVLLVIERLPGQSAPNTNFGVGDTKENPMMACIGGVREALGDLDGDLRLARGLKVPDAVRNQAPADLLRLFFRAEDAEPRRRLIAGISQANSDALVAIAQCHASDGHRRAPGQIEVRAAVAMRVFSPDGKLLGRAEQQLSATDVDDGIAAARAIRKALARLGDKAFERALRKL